MLAPFLHSAQEAFITNWKTNNPGGSEDNQITIPTFPGEVYNYTVEWGDGATDSSVNGDITHTYATPGTYKIKIDGLFPRIYFFGASHADDSELDNKKLISVEQWGSIEWTSMEYAFFNCTEMQVSALDIPLFNNATNLNSMFNGCYAMQGAPSFAAWQVGNILEMNNLFADCHQFASDISEWDVSSVSDVSFMFSSAQKFNSDISSWNVSSVTNMRALFQSATSFNQDIGNWDVSNVTDMLNMFFGATAFDQDIGTWNVGKVNNMNSMFSSAKTFNQDIGGWDVSLVTDMSYMFFEALSFDQNIGNWNISVVSDLTDMFRGAKLSTHNYDGTLTGWSGITVNNGLSFNGGNSMYCRSDKARKNLIDAFGWTINDAGVDPECYFKTTWKTDNPGASGDNQITIPTFPGEIYDYTVDWGDGSSNTNVTGDITHSYTEPGIYQVSISGEFPRIYFYDLEEFTSSNDRDKIITVDQWGDMPWSSMQYAFMRCKNLDVIATDIPDLTYATSIKSMFASTNSLVYNPSINNWNTSSITNMSQVFSGASLFNQPLGNWDVSQVTDMSRMFQVAENFNQDIGNWDVSKVRDMQSMFYHSKKFNQDISSWDVSKVTVMSGLFSETTFNQDISGWDISNVTNMYGMFIGNVEFNQNIGNWNVSSVRNMGAMFTRASAFNQDIGNWNVSSAEGMFGMFEGATSFDQDLSGWNIGNVSEMSQMFLGAGLSNVNYDRTLSGWSELPNLQSNITFDAGNSQYCESEDARQFIIDAYGWTITDDGKVPLCNEDNDSDGVFDHKDACLNTRPDVIVNEEGCEIISSTAITVYGVAPTCPGVANASIQISSSLVDYAFNVSITGPSSEQYTSVSLDVPLEINNLSSGLYSIHITVPNTSYAQMYGVQINEVGAISGKRENLDTQLKSASYAVQGSTLYTVDINGQVKIVEFDSPGLNTILLNNLSNFNSISIAGESDCQGSITDTFSFAEGIVMYPSITTDKVFIEGLEADSSVEIYDVTGRLLFQKKLIKTEQEALNFASFDTGMYPVKIISAENTTTFKIIKQ